MNVHESWDKKYAEKFLPIIPVKVNPEYPLQHTILPADSNNLFKFCSCHSNPPTIGSLDFIELKKLYKCINGSDISDYDFNQYLLRCNSKK